MALRYPGAPPQIRSSLLGPYTLAGGPKAARAQSQATRGLNLTPYQAPNLSELTGKYLKDLPQIDIQTDPSQLYEQSMGGYRADVSEAITEAGRQAIGQAAASGREVSDVMARYLPEAVKGYGRGAADVAARAGEMAQQGQVAKSELELRRTGMAQEMARFDQSQQQQMYQFKEQLQTQYQMHRETLSNNLRIALANAQSQRENQAIRNAHEMSMARLNQQFQMKANTFAQQQQNARQSQMLSTYDKWQSADFSLDQLKAMLQGVNTVADNQMPTLTIGGEGSTYPRYNVQGRAGLFGFGASNY